MSEQPAATSIRPLRLGTRTSALARWQAEWVAARLRERGIEVALVPISTRGDREQGTITTIGGDGLFTKELQRALLAGEIDLAVHSLKDLPTEPVEGLVIGAVPERAATDDVLVSRGGLRLADLPDGAVVATGSLRRRAQLWHARPDLQMRDIRGNVDTRLRKLRDGACDALVLAEAGLARLGLADQVSERLPHSLMLPAVGQGALGIECRANDSRTRDAVAPLEHAASRAAVEAERAMLRALCGGCLAPIGGWARVEADGQLCLTAAVLSADGRMRLTAEARGLLAGAVDLGVQVAADLRSQGADDLIRAARNAQPSGESPTPE